MGIQPKVKVFLWRAASKCLPTKENLMRRGIQVEGACGVCNMSFENEWHIFIECPFVKECWKEAGMENEIRYCSERAESFVDFLFLVVEIKEDLRNEKTGMLLWQIWRDCNSKVWKNITPNAHRSVIISQHCMQEWATANIKQETHSNGNRRARICKGWHNLPNGWVKCGVDAAFFAHLNMTGTGMILWDAEGSFMAAKVVCFPGCMRVDEGEAMGIYEALSWIKQRGVEFAVIETDCKVVADAISSSSVDLSELGAIVDNCRSLLYSCRGFHIKHVRRDVNMVAHELARVSKNFIGQHVWDEPPSFVEGLLHFPCICHE